MCVCARMSVCVRLCVYICADGIFRRSWIPWQERTLGRSGWGTDFELSKLLLHVCMCIYIYIYVSLSLLQTDVEEQIPEGDKEGAREATSAGSGIERQNVLI